MANIANKDKSFEIRWVEFPILGVLYCSCGKDNNFSGVKDLTCSECGSKWDFSSYIFIEMKKKGMIPK